MVAVLPERRTGRRKAGWAAGADWKGCRAEAAGTRTGRNAGEDPGAKPGLRAAAAAPEGSDAHAAMLLQGFAMAAHRPAEWLTVKGRAKRDLATERCNGHQLARTT
jgi:hypothetical protein